MEEQAKVEAQAGGRVEASSLRSSKTREEVTQSAWYRDLSTPKLSPGDAAFDFTLPVLDPDHGVTSQTVRLSTHAGRKPVALIFGSYT